MNANRLVQHFDKLTAEERFTLVVNAGARGDDAEQERLLSSAPRITFSVGDGAPYAEAFDEIAVVVLLQVLDMAGDYFDALDTLQDTDDEDADEDEDADDAQTDGDDDAAAPGEPDSTLKERLREIFLAVGYLLKTKVAGWKLWCERRRLPPFRSWENAPGYARLQRALDLAENGGYAGRGAAFTPEGMLRFLNRAGPAGEPEMTALPCTPDVIADATERLFQDRVRFHGGEK